jgi:hypothetical protein
MGEHDGPKGAEDHEVGRDMAVLAVQAWKG